MKSVTFSGFGLAILMADADTLNITLDDLQEHIVKYGLDVYPPLDVQNETQRAQDLFQALQAEWPDFFQELTFAPRANQFKILASFETRVAVAKVPTLVFTPRGPVFAFPFRFADPHGPFSHRAYKDNDASELFSAAFRKLRRVFPGLQARRVGLVRELTFGTGKTKTVPELASRYGAFPGATAIGVNYTITHRDDRCNIRTTVQTAELRRQARSQVSGEVLSDEVEYALKVRFDVNNHDMKAQSDADIEITLERARCFWPKALLDFINWRADDDRD